MQSDLGWGPASGKLFAESIRGIVFSFSKLKDKDILTKRNKTCLQRKLLRLKI